MAATIVRAVPAAAPLTVGTAFLDNLERGLTAGDAGFMASLFHPGVTYILNGEPRPNCAAMATAAAWSHVFARCQWDVAAASRVREVHPGHVLYHFKVVVRDVRTGDTREGHFGDTAVVDAASGRCMLLHRSADATGFFPWYDGLFKP